MLVSTLAERETRLRLFLTIAAYAYECCSEIIMEDSAFDAGCQMVNLKQSTNRPHLDEWWRKHFSPDTGMWITKHPELSRVSAIYHERWRGKTCVLKDGRFVLN